MGADSIGEKGVKAEIIGNRAAKKFIDDYEFRACIESTFSGYASPAIKLLLMGNPGTKYQE